MPAGARAAEHHAVLDRAYVILEECWAAVEAQAAAVLAAGRLTDAEVEAIVASALAPGALPAAA